MRPRLGMLFFVSAVSLSCMPPLLALNLDEAFAKALERSEIIQTADLDVQIAEANRTGALTRMKPRVDLQGRALYKLQKPDRDDWDNVWDPGVHTELRQPLYDGGLSDAAIQSSESLIEVARWTAASRRDELYLQVLQLFYEILRSEQDLKTLQETRDLYAERVGVLNEREKIGRSRLAEVLAARTQLTLTDSQIVAAKTQNRVAQEQLSWLLGLPPPLRLDDRLALDRIRRDNIPYDAKAFYPTIEAARARVEAAKAQVELSEAALRPQLDFIAAHDWAYLDPSDQGQHVFSLGLGLTWTLYDAGETRALVSSATISRNQAQIFADRATRETQLNLSLASRILDEGIEQYDALTKALEVANRNVRTQRQEYDSGLITNLEVLEALNQRLQIKRDLDLTLYRTKIAYLEKRIRMGKSPSAS